MTELRTDDVGSEPDARKHHCNGDGERGGERDGGRGNEG